MSAGNYDGRRSAGSEVLCGKFKTSEAGSYHVYVSTRYFQSSDIFEEEREQCICIYYQFTLLYCFYFGLYGSGSFFFAVKNRKVMKRASEISGKDAKMNVRKIMEFMETFSAPGIKNSLNNCRSQIKENCRCRDFAGTFFEKSVELNLQLYYNGLSQK